MYCLRKGEQLFYHLCFDNLLDECKEHGLLVDDDLSKRKLHCMIEDIKALNFEYFTLPKRCCVHYS